MGRWFSSSEIVSAIIVAASVGMCAIVFIDPQAPSTSADDWRRTASGWERSNTWQIAASQPTVSQPSPPARGRFDTHPAVIALAQLTAGLLVLASFPVQQKRSENPDFAFSARIAQSFRASVFGS